MNGPRAAVLGSEGPVLDEPMGDGVPAIARRAVREAARAALHEVLRRNRPEVARPTGAEDGARRQTIGSGLTTRACVRGKGDRGDA